MCRPSASSLEYRNVSPGELRDILIATGMDARHASFVVRIEEGIARGDACTDSHDLGRLIRREPTPLAQVIAAASWREQVAHSCLRLTSSLRLALRGERRRRHRLHQCHPQSLHHLTRNGRHKWST
jgi:hypothetical protein